MLLQIDKILNIKSGEDELGKIRTDIIGGVKRTYWSEKYLIVELDDGNVKKFSPGELECSFTAEIPDELKYPYDVYQIWLLNDDGKTLRKLI